jgi:membrane dipeptidase
MSTPAAERLWREAVVIDGLTFYGDGEAAGLRAAGIAAVNMTVSHFEADFETAFDQLAQWRARIDAPDSPWRLVERVSDIEAARAAGCVGLIMGWQNLRPIADRIERLHLAYAAGLRIAQLTYNQRNFMGDGCLESADSGLSALGEQAVGVMNELGIAIDLSHVGERACLRACALSKKPVLLTHANAKAVTGALRNKTDAVIRAVADTGGVVGASIYGPMCWDGDPVRPPKIEDFIRHLDHIAGLVGREHVAIGTDLPVVSDLAKVAHITELTLARSPAAIAAYAAAFSNDIRARYLSDCSSHADLVRVVAALLERDWSKTEVRGLLGENLRWALAGIWGG